MLGLVFVVPCFLNTLLQVHEKDFGQNDAVFSCYNLIKPTYPFSKCDVIKYVPEIKRKSLLIQIHYKSV